MDPDPSQTEQGHLRGNADSPMSPTVILEPTTVSVPEHTPWYRKIFGGQSSRTQNVWRLSFVAMLFLALVVILRGNQTTNLGAKAGLYKARVSILPKETKVPPDTFVQLWVTSDATVTKGEFILSFDPKKLTIADIRAPEGSTVASALSWTPLATANANGVLSVKFNPDSTNAAPPKGTFQLVNLTVRKKSTATQGTADVTLDKNAIVLFHDSSPFTITADSTTVVTIGVGK